MIFNNILTEKHFGILKRLKNLPEGSYLAGGTALALQLGHRTSLDFDFYTKTRFEPEVLLKTLQETFNDVKVERIAEGTLVLNNEGLSFSIFKYPYDLISKKVTFQTIELASIEDIAAMKMVAISMRGKRRDFIDAYYLLQKFSLEEIIDFTIEKYPSYQPMVILKGLIYFEDAEDEDLSRGIKIFDQNYSWAKAKKKIFEEVEKYQKKLLL